MKIVTNARSAWRWFSVQAAALVAIIPMAWSQLPPESQALVPEEYRPWVITVVAVAGIIGRLIDQGGEK
jgi:hypothetical protein